MILVVDAGLTVCKAAAFDSRGDMVASHRLASPRRTGGLATHHYVTRVWHTVAATIRTVASQLPPGARVEALAVSTAGVGGLLVGPDGRVQGLGRPTAEARAAACNLRGWEPYGCQAFASSSVLLAQLLAWRPPSPDAPPGTYKVGSLHTYLVWRLTGRWVADVASGPAQLSWPQPFQAVSPTVQLPELVANEARVGTIAAPTAARLGLSPTVLVAAGGHDGVCASFGAGAYHEGDCCLTLGTNFVPRPVRLDRTGAGFSYPIRPGRWAWTQEKPHAGRALNVTAEALIGPGDMEAAHVRLGELAEQADAEGARRPDPSLLDLTVSRLAARVHALLADGYRPGAVYGARVDLSVMQLLELLGQARAWGWSPRRYVASGGFAQSGYIARRLAMHLGAPLALVPADSGLRGAASFAACAAGLFDTPEEALGTYFRGGPTLSPPALRTDPGWKGGVP